MDLLEDEISDYWRLCDELTVQQAALLIVGVDPASEIGANVEDWKTHERPKGYEAVKHGLSRALRKGIVTGDNVAKQEWIDQYTTTDIHNTTDIKKSVVERDSLVAWLKSRGINTGFFFPVEKNTGLAPYLDASNPRYAPKLAAAVNAWLAVTNPNGKTPKSALAKWLRENAAPYGLSDDEGKPNEQGIEETAKVANWDAKGGAPKTPTRPIVKNNPPTK